MSVYRAEHAYRRNRGKTYYRNVLHPGSPHHIPPFYCQIPIDFLPWDNDQGILAFPRKTTPWGRCRCGYVERVYYFKLGHRSSSAKKTSANVLQLGLKIMNKDQIIEQQDDVLNEIRIMARLQPIGLSSPKVNPHFLVWEYGSDLYNEYIATEFAANGSMIQYVRQKVQHLKSAALPKLGKRNNSNMKLLKSQVDSAVGQTWMVHGLFLYLQVMKGVVYMHSRDVAHLDLDPCNVVIDRDEVARIIDFGSSEIMKSTLGLAGTLDTLTKYKPLYVSPEVRRNNRKRAPRPGFDGAKADMWSLGVLLYQLVCWGFTYGERAVSHDSKWRQNVMYHAKKKHLVPVENCYLCYRQVSLPTFVIDILASLLSDSPSDRMTAEDVVDIISGPLAQVGTFKNKLMLPYHSAFETFLQSNNGHSHSSGSGSSSTTSSVCSSSSSTTNNHQNGSKCPQKKILPEQRPTFETPTY